MPNATLTATHTLTSEITSFPADTSVQNGWTPSLNWNTTFASGLRGLYDYNSGTGNWYGVYGFISRSGSSISSLNQDIQVEVDVYLTWGADGSIVNPSAGNQSTNFAINFQGSGTQVNFTIKGIEGTQYTVAMDTTITLQMNYLTDVRNMFIYTGTRPSSIISGWNTFRFIITKTGRAEVYVSATGTNFFVPLTNTSGTDAPLTTGYALTSHYIALNQGYSSADVAISEIREYKYDITQEQLTKGIGIKDPNGKTVIGNDSTDIDQSSDGYSSTDYLGDGSGNKSIGGRYIDSSGNTGLIGSGSEDLIDLSSWTATGGNAQQWNGSRDGISIFATRYHRQLNDVGFGSFDLSLVNSQTRLFGMHNMAVSIADEDGNTFFKGFIKEPAFKAANKYRAYLQFKEFLSRLKEKTTSFNYSINLQKNVKIIFSSSGYINAVHSDLDSLIIGATSGDSGYLIAFNNDQKYWIVRPLSSSDTFAIAETINVSSGTGSGTSIAGSSVLQAFTYDTIASLSGTQITLNGQYTDEVTALSSYGVLITPNPDGSPSSTDEDFATMPTGTGTATDVNNDDTNYVTADTGTIIIKGVYSGTRANATVLELEVKWYHVILPLGFDQTLYLYLYNYRTASYDTIKSVLINPGLGGAGKESGIIRISGTATDYINDFALYGGTDKEFTLKLYYSYNDVRLYYANLTVYTDPKYYNVTGFPLSSKGTSTLTSSTNFETSGVDAGDTVIIGKRNDLVLAELLDECLYNEGFTYDIDSEIVGFTAGNFSDMKYTTWDAIQSILAKENAYMYVNYSTSIIYIRKRTNLTAFGIIFSNVDNSVYSGIVTGEPDVSFKEGDDVFHVEVLGASFKGADGQDITIYADGYRSGSFAKTLTISDRTILSVTEAQQRVEAELAKLGTDSTEKMPTFTFELMSTTFVSFQTGYTCYYQYHGKLWGPMPIQAIDAEQYNTFWRYSLTIGWS